MATVMVRARPQTRDKLRELSRREGISAVELLDVLVREHEDAVLLASFANMLSTHAGAARAELAGWDSGPWDGLPDEDFAWVGSDYGTDAS